MGLRYAGVPPFFLSEVTAFMVSLWFDRLTMNGTAHPPFVVSLSNHVSAVLASFDKLRTNREGGED